MTQEVLPASDKAIQARDEKDALRWRMALQRQVELKMNWLIEQMTELVDGPSEVVRSGLEKGQFKNLLAVALDTHSVEVIKHYIYYQVGRDVPGASWRRNQFGQKLVEAIENLKKEAKLAANAARHDAGMAGEGSQDQIDEAWLLLTRAYLGHLNRYFYYKKEASRWPPETN